MVSTGFDHNGISFKKNLSPSTYFSALSKAMNSDFIVGRAMHVCLKDFKDTVAPQE